MSQKRQIHFFIPLYFDLASFRILRGRILAQLPADYLPRFHLLDDSAGADPALRSFGLPDVELVPMPFNLGHQRALVFGLRSFLREHRGECLIATLDGDGEDRPEDLPRMLERFLAEEADHPIVLARRTRRRESLAFKLMYALYKRVFRFLTGTVIQTGNFALMHSSAIRRIIYHPYFDLAYASTLLSIGSKLHYVPCPRGLRYEGHSKMNFSRLMIHGVRMLMPFMDRIAIRGLVFFSVTFALALLGSLGLALLHFAGGSAPVWLLPSLLIALALSFLCACNFLILITVFTNVQGVALSRLESAPE